MKLSENSARTNLRTQFLTVFIRHIFVSVLAAVLGVSVFGWILTQKVYNILYSCIFTCIYFYIIYSKCAAIAGYDLKSYTKTKSYPAKGIVLILPVILFTLALDILRLIMWNYMSDGTHLTGIPAVISNSVFIIWTAPFNGIISIKSSPVPLIIRIMIYSTPLLSAFLGYFAGYKGFNLTEKLTPFIYEDKGK